MGALTGAINTPYRQYWYSMRVLLLQENQSKFCDMLKREFPMYRDVTQPLLIATARPASGTA